jgi:hypothetical protein
MKAATILCAVCHEMLWEMKYMGSAGGMQFIPATPGVPPFYAGEKNCPYCDQEYAILVQREESVLVKNTQTGQLEIARLERKLAS